MLDRIDLVCQVEQVPALELVGPPAEDRTRSACIRGRVIAARARQGERLGGSGALCNGDMDGPLTRRTVMLDDDETLHMVSVRDRFDFSGRGHDRVLRVARTIADLDGRERVEIGDLDEALSYRLHAWERVAA